MANADLDLLRRKFGKKLPASMDAKVTLTIGGLCKLLEAARRQERAMTPRDRDGDSMASIIEAMMGRRS